MNKICKFTLTVLATVFLIGAGLAIQPLDNSITQLSHDDSNWVYRTDTASFNGDSFYGYGYFDINGTKVEGMATFDVAGFDTFTTIVGVPDYSRGADGFASFRLDGVDTRVQVNSASVYTVRAIRGQVGVPISIDLTGHRKLTIDMMPNAVLAQPRLLNQDSYNDYNTTVNTIDVWSNPIDNGEMVYVDAGNFVMGSRAGVGNANESPRHSVTLDGYYIYKDNVTVAQFRKFTRMTGYDFNWARKPVYGWQESNPMTLVSFYDAQAYVKWAGGTLPTEAQWEKAARGIDARSYPWGNTWEPNFAGNDRYSVNATGSYPAGASPYGVQDLVGNVRQWTADRYDANYYDYSPSMNPTGPNTGNYRVLRGSGGYDNTDYRLTVRDSASPSQRDEYTGFRCVREALGQTAIDDYSPVYQPIVYDYQYQQNPPPVVIITHGTSPYIDNGNYDTTFVYYNGEYCERYYSHSEHIWRYRRANRPYYDRPDYDPVVRPTYYPPVQDRPSYNPHPGKSTAPVYNNRKPDYVPTYKPQYIPYDRPGYEDVKTRPGVGGKPDYRPNSQQPVVRPNNDRPTTGKPAVRPDQRPTTEQEPVTKGSAAQDNKNDNSKDNGKDKADAPPSGSSGKSTAPGSGK